MYEKYIKRGLDFIFALCLLILTSPILILSAIAIKLSDSKGPVLFKQQRPGKNEKIFTIYKFRTMKVATKNEQGEAMSDMERMTTIGKLLRKTSIDELPQCINVLQGDMSFIGPRPLLVQYLKHYNAEQRKRHHVRPGISGWAQVHGRNTIDWESKFQYDVWYAENCSLKTDLKVLVKTILNVVKRKDIDASSEQTMSYFGD